MINRKSKLMLCVVSMALSANAYSADKGENYITKPFWNINKSYRAEFEIKEIHEEDADCSTTGIFAVGGDSIFEELSIDEEKKEMIVSFDYIKDEGNGSNLPEIEKPYKLCIGKTKDYKYRRAGGIDTGVLVIPYKVRSGDLFGDSTVGPYVAFKGDSISLLATFGLTQVSVADINEADVKSETGLSAAVGLVWSVSDSFDIGLVVGKDHLSGEAGDNFKYQDKSWWSFSIGYNFTTN